MEAVLLHIATGMGVAMEAVLLDNETTNQINKSNSSKTGEL